MDKQIVVPPHNRILLSNKKEHTTDAWQRHGWITKALHQVKKVKCNLNTVTAIT